jgi:peptidoglycan-N-acetylglucosamine deacetylase
VTRLRGLAAALLSVAVLSACGSIPAEFQQAGAGRPSAAEPATEEPTPVLTPAATESPSSSPTRTPSKKATPVGPRVPTPTKTPKSEPEPTPTSKPSSKPTSEPTKKAKPKKKPSQEPSSPPLGRGRAIYLTFDDGPGAFTQQVLDILARYNAKATFFVIGENVGGSPSLVRAMRQAGHSVQNHTWGHPNLTKYSNSGIRSQVSDTDNAIRNAGGGRSTCVRPPYGATNKRVRSVLQGMGKRQALWTIDTNDWQRPGANAIYRTVVNQARPGSIVLAHDGGGMREQTVAALPRILETLSDRGYKFRVMC